MLKVTGATHEGAVRKQNQDVYRWNILGSSLGYAMVCDGMGGENAGDVASQATIEIVDRYLKKGLKADMPLNSVRSVMLSAVSAANAIVYEQAQRNPDFIGMGTTLVLVVVSGDTAHICHVGDSRIYSVREKRAEQLTRDHSMVQLLVDRGELTPDEAAVHPKKHFITRAVGVSPRVEPDYAEYPLDRLDRFLLCSDGLSNYLEPGRVAEQVQECARRATVGPLIEYALERGGADNITAVLMTMD